MQFYPAKIDKHFQVPKYLGEAENANAIGIGASFVCGSFVRFFLEIDAETKEIRDAKFTSNGCGFTIAAADVLAETIVGKKLTEFHALGETRAGIERELGEFAAHRAHCIAICLDALQQAFAAFRSFYIEEFAGEKALICTCFGISEETIEKIIRENKSETVEAVGDICSAGTGCGSCRFLIQELIDIDETKARA